MDEIRGSDSSTGEGDRIAVVSAGETARPARTNRLRRFSINKKSLTILLVVGIALTAAQFFLDRGGPGTESVIDTGSDTTVATVDSDNVLLVQWGDFRVTADGTSATLAIVVAMMVIWQGSALMRGIVSLAQRVLHSQKSGEEISLADRIAAEERRSLTREEE